MSKDGPIIVHDYTMQGCLERIKAIMAEAGLEIEKVDFESWCG